MIRKLITCAVLTYLAFELFERLFDPNSRTSKGQRRRALKRALNEDEGRMNLTGPGRGAMIEAEDSDGARSSYVVGRGVVG